MALQFRRGLSANLPDPSDAAIGEPLFTTDDGKLRVKKADGTYAVIGSGSSSSFALDQIPAPPNQSATATLSWVPGTGWSIIQGSTPPPSSGYDPAIDFLPSPLVGSDGIEVGGSYGGTVTLSPTTGTTGLQFIVNGSPTSLEVVASQSSPSVTSAAAFSLADAASRQRSVIVRATDGASTKDDTTTLKFGWRIALFSLPATTTLDANVVQAAMQSSSALNQIKFQPNATVGDGGVIPTNVINYTVASTGPANSIYCATTVSGPSDAYGWTPVFTEPLFSHTVNEWELVGTFSGIDPGDGVARSYRVVKHSSLWATGDVLSQGIR